MDIAHYIKCNGKGFLEFFSNINGRMHRASLLGRAVNHVRALSAKALRVQNPGRTVGEWPTTATGAGCTIDRLRADRS
jgi:hypothetical protein